MSAELLSYDTVAQRAKNAVAQFPSDTAELWAIKMRPNKGYIQLVRVASIINDSDLLSFLS